MLSMNPDKLPSTPTPLPKTHVGPVYCAKFNS